MQALVCIAIIFSYIYEDSDSLIVYDDTLTICGQHIYNHKVHIADTAGLLVRSWDGSDSTGWLLLSAPDIRLTGLSMIHGDGSGYWGGTNTHANGYGPGYGTAGNAGGGAGGGAGFGGTGGNGGGMPGYGGPAYGSSSDTIIQMGSGGGGGSLGGVEGFGGNGGASICLRGNVVFADSSLIRALGEKGDSAAIVAGGGGSGGGIMIWGDSVIITNSSFHADGGSGGDVNPEYGYGGGGAGGGRCKVFYSSVLDTSDIEITCQGGASGVGGWGNGQPGTSGSIYIGTYTNVLEFVNGVRWPVQIRPNPSQGMVQVCTINTPMQIKIFDCAGRNISTVVITDENQTIDLRSLTSGVFFFQIGDTGMLSKFIIVH
jgi:hypothetical protein